VRYRGGVLLRRSAEHARRVAQGQATQITHARRDASSTNESREEFHMLRITTNNTAHVLVLRLEGRLEGPWVAVLAQCFGLAVRNLRGRRLCVDLNGVTFVDAAGKTRLAAMYAHGARLLGEDIETKAIVAEIVGESRGANQ
jgi:anti-anti-sigma regulatory factor